MSEPCGLGPLARSPSSSHTLRRPKRGALPVPVGGRSPEFVSRTPEGSGTQRVPRWRSWSPRVDLRSMSMGLRLVRLLHDVVRGSRELCLTKQHYGTSVRVVAPPRQFRQRRAGATPARAPRGGAAGTGRPGCRGWCLRRAPQCTTWCPSVRKCVTFGTTSRAAGNHIIS
jgi:hypothetical protein